MKVLLKLGISLSCVLLLSACQTNPESSKQSTKKESNASKTLKRSKKTTQSSKKTVTKSTSDQSGATEPSRSQSEENDLKDYETLYADTLSKIASDINNVSHYAFYDIDKNGSKELFTGTDVGNGIHPIALYYFKNDVSTY